MTKQFIYLFFFVVIATDLHAQKTPQEYAQEQEKLRRMQLMTQMDSGIYYMEEEMYEQADAKFKFVLGSIRAVPSDMAYYFGKNSYFLRQYKQSIDWLNKYIQLKGTNGQFSKDAVEWMRKSEAALLSERALEAEKNKQVLSSNYDIDCGPTGKVICPVCHGDNVIIKKGVFGDEYKTCPYCNEHGILTCEEYNLLVKGQLKPKF